MKRLIVLFAVLAGLVSGQTVLYPTTLSSAVTDTGEHIVLASWAGITVPGPNRSNLKNLLIDGEMFEAQAIDPPGTNYIRVIRGVRATLRTTHASGATVWAGPTASFRDTDPTGGCTRTALAYVPVISIQSRGTFDCLGPTGAQQWIRTDRPGATYYGTAIASGASSTVNPPAETFKISGTSALVAFTTPAGWVQGHCMNIIPTGNFTLTANAGNIGKAATAVTGRVMKVCLGVGGLWYPSY
jgi:hypothetical protein